MSGSRMDNDDDLTKMKRVESPSSTSRSSTPTNATKPKRPRLTFPFGPCRVCSDSATGIHYGIATCEGCKGFFKRSILRKEKYRCYFDNSCLVNVANRNRCKACRFQRCIEKGMSVDGVKMGRIPKLVKERALLEQKEQQMRQEAMLAKANQRPNEVHNRDSSCSSLSDRSIENYDPNTLEIDAMETQTSTMRRNCQSSKILPSNDNNNSSSFNDSSFYNHRAVNHSVSSDHDINSTTNSTENRPSSFVYRTKYPTYLPDDFTLDETDGMSQYEPGILSNDVFKHVRSISNKLSQNKSSLVVDLTEEELTFIRYLRWSSYNIFLRHSKRVKQLEVRMNRMIRDGVTEYPGDNATATQFLATVPKTLEVIVRSSVLYIQELPGMANIESSNLHKIILHRSFDWYMLKYGCLLNENGQSYILSSDGFQYTRHWMNSLYGTDMVDAMFQFTRYLRKLNLSESEHCLVLPLQICCPDASLKSEELSRMLRHCYLYALYQELCYNHGTHEGKIMCSKILQLLDLLIPLNELYDKNVGSRLLEA